jgi:hypothetical protein
MSVSSVEGHCAEGSEFFMCEPAGGPRSTLTLKVAATVGDAVATLRQHLLAGGWAKRGANRFCKVGKGCVEPVATSRPDRLVLNWFSYYDPCDYQACRAPR